MLQTMAYRQLANVRLALGQTEAALADCESAMRLAPDDAQSYMCRAGLYQAVGQSERAREDARTALKLLDPADKAHWGFWEYNFRIDAFSILGQPQQAADEALALFKNEGLRDWFLAFERNAESANDPQVAFMLAMARCKAGEKDEARRWYDKGLQWIDKDKPEDETLLRFRDEATTLLGVTPPIVEPAPEPAAKVERRRNQRSPRQHPRQRKKRRNRSEVARYGFLYQEEKRPVRSQGSNHSPHRARHLPSGSLCAPRAMAFVFAL